jgi:hypothetical protein
MIYYSPRSANSTFLIHELLYQPNIIASVLDGTMLDSVLNVISFIHSGWQMSFHYSKFNCQEIIPDNLFFPLLF